MLLVYISVVMFDSLVLACLHMRIVDYGHVEGLRKKLMAQLVRRAGENSGLFVVLK